MSNTTVFEMSASTDEKGQVSYDIGLDTDAQSEVVFEVDKTLQQLINDDKCVAVFEWLDTKEKVLLKKQDSEAPQQQLTFSVAGPGTYKYELQISSADENTGTTAQDAAGLGSTATNVRGDIIVK